MAGEGEGSKTCRADCLAGALSPQLDTEELSAPMNLVAEGGFTIFQ
jgi:hypothetical protein